MHKFIFHSFSSSIITNDKFSFPLRIELAGFEVVAGCEVEAASLLVDHEYPHFCSSAGLPGPGEDK